MKLKSIFALIILSIAFFGCTPANIQKAITYENAAVPLVNLGLTIAGSTVAPGLQAIVPLNTMGEQALVAMQEAYATKQGISPDAAKNITDAATLGFKVTGNNKIVPVVPEAANALVGILNAIVTQPAATTGTVPVVVPPTK